MGELSPSPRLHTPQARLSERPQSLMSARSYLRQNQTAAKEWVGGVYIALTSNPSPSKREGSLPIPLCNLTPFIRTLEPIVVISRRLS